MTDEEVVVTAAQERRELDVRLYVLALIALARQLQDKEERSTGGRDDQPDHQAEQPDQPGEREDASQVMRG
jgi:hypothetical protein